MSDLKFSPKASKFLLETLERMGILKEAKQEITAFLFDPFKPSRPLIEAVERIAASGNGGAIMSLSLADGTPHEKTSSWIRLLNDGVDQDGWPHGISRAEKLMSKFLYESGRDGPSEDNRSYVDTSRDDPDPIHPERFQARLREIFAIAPEMIGDRIREDIRNPSGIRREGEDIQKDKEVSDPNTGKFHMSNEEVGRMMSELSVALEKAGGLQTDLGMRHMIAAAFFDRLPPHQAVQNGLDLEKRVREKPQDPFSTDLQAGPEELRPT